MKKMFLLLLAASFPAFALEGISFSHKDWIVACDNSGTCRAAGYQAGDGMEHGYSASLLLTRAAGKNAAIHGEVSILIDDGESSKGTLSLNGKSLGTVTLKDGTGTLNYTQTAELARALAKKANIMFTSSDGLRMRISDAGAAAVLLKMDDFQKRVNTPSALIRPGNSAAAVLEPQPLPKIRRVVPKGGEKRSIERGSPEYALLAAKLKNSECNIADEQRAGPVCLDRFSGLISGSLARQGYPRCRRPLFYQA